MLYLIISSFSAFNRRFYVLIPVQFIDDYFTLTHSTPFVSFFCAASCEEISLSFLTSLDLKFIVEKSNTRKPNSSKQSPFFEFFNMINRIKVEIDSCCCGIWSVPICNFNHFLAFRLFCLSALRLRFNSLRCLQIIIASYRTFLKSSDCMSFAVNVR